MAKNKKFIELIKENGYTNSILARKLNVSETAVRHWIKERNRPSVVQLLKMTKIFSMSVVDLYKLFYNEKK